METSKKIVRLLATDIDGSLKVSRALRKIKGVGFAFSKAVCISAGIDGTRRIGSLSPDELKKLEGVMKNPALPSWLLNRRRDIETGKDVHILGSGIALKKMEDVSILKRIRAYRGIRHEFGLPVRGQRTRTSFRTQKTVGVTKKVAIQARKKSEESAKEKKS